MGPQLADDLSAAKTLWHYTSFQGLIGILQSSNLRLSNIGFLNDGLEFDLGVEKVTNAIRNEFHGKPENARTQVEMVVGKFFGYIRKRAVYVASFSEDGDSLSMWRTHVGSGPSYAIGFDTELLLAVANSGNAVVKKVLYDPVEIAMDVQARIGDYFAGYENSDQANPPHGATHHFFDSGAKLARGHPEWCALYKDGSFGVEKEYRLIKVEWNPAQIAFRQAGSLIVPYIELALPLKLRKENPIKYLRVGPSAHMDECVEVLNIMGSRFCPAALIKADKSSSPFRNW